MGNNLVFFWFTKETVPKELMEKYPLKVGCYEPCYHVEKIWACTRESGHEGPHVAHVINGDIVAIWDQEEETK